MATSVSARRWRTAWNVAIGRPNWMRSSACSRAELEHRARRADELVADRELGEPRPRAHQSTGAAARRPSTSPVTSTSPSDGSTPCTGPQVERRGARVTATWRSVPADHDHGVDGPSSAPMASPSTRQPVAVELPRCVAPPTAGQHDTGRAVGASPSASRATTWSRADEVDVGRALELEQRATPPRAVSNASASCQPSSVERGVERRHRCAVSVAWRRLRSNSSRSSRVHHGRSRGRAGAGR